MKNLNKLSGGPDMFAKYIKLRLILAVLVLFFAAVVLLDQTWIKPVGATDGSVSVIVALKDEPAAVYKARAEKSGQVVSNEALQAYRDQLRSKQDSFLTALASRGVTASVISRNVKNPDGSVAATIPLRYTLVYNGLALSVQRSAIDAIKAMPEVKGVQLNDLLYTALNKSVDYINAPKVYAAVKELTQFDDLREGFEGQGINIAVLDTGIDWT
ncbi:MAG TPA: hypothetical protein VJ521_15385, partial [Acidobacteriota bacterium]|nr:hypothetical protein [Acidobacteriota bacterium]